MATPKASGFSGAFVKLDGQFRFDHLAATLMALVVPTIGLFVASARWPGSEAAVGSIFVLTGVCFVHQFGARGIPLVLGFLGTVVVVGLIAHPLNQGLGIAACGALAAGFLALYSAWIVELQTRRDHRIHAEAEKSSAVTGAMTDVDGLGEVHDQQDIRLKSWASLVNVVRGCSSTLKFDGLATFVLDSVESLFPAEQVSLWIVQPAEPPGPAVTGRRYQRGSPQATEVSVADGLDQLALQGKQNILVADREKDYRFQGDRALYFDGRSALACPLMEGNEVYGNLRVTSRAPDRFNHEDMVILSHIAGVVSMSAMNVRLYERTEQLALTDGQTGLYKRYYFESRFSEECRRALRTSTPLSMLLFDIDHFKKVNDTYGHPVGDLVLIEMGKLIRAVDWAGPLPCRWGGEEFLLVLPDASPDQARSCAESRRLRLRSTAFKSGGESAAEQTTFSVTVSTGIATFPKDTGDPARLFQICDRRLYAAKNSGRDRVSDND